MPRVGLAPLSLRAPVRKALETFEKHLECILQRWTSTHTNARMEGLNVLFQAARARARGYRNTATFITMIYLSLRRVATYVAVCVPAFSAEKVCRDE